MTDAVPLHLVVFVFATFLGGLIAGVAGFAFGLIASAIWLHVITPAQSAALISGYAIVIQGLAIWKLRSALQVSRLLPFVAGGAVGIPLGALLLGNASADHLRASIGFLLVVFSIYSLVRPKFRCASAAASPMAWSVLRVELSVRVQGWRAFQSSFGRRVAAGPKTNNGQSFSPSSSQFLP